MKAVFFTLVVALVGCSDSTPTRRYRLDAARQDSSCREPVGFFQPRNGAIATEEAAKEVGFQYLHEAFPRDELRPLSAKLQNGVWHVEGYIEVGAAGGAANVLMCQSNGRAIKIYHEQ